MKFSVVSVFAILAFASGHKVARPEEVEFGEAISVKAAANCRDYCAGTVQNYSTPQYVCCDFRLGPKRLPTKLPLGDLVDDYDRFGGLCPGQFLQKWYNTTARSYIYPPQSGFQLDIQGNSIEGTFKLPVGLLLDRFGSEYGTFVSPKAAPYNQRALPPSNLDTPVDDPRYPYNYHVYRVITPLTVTSGPIAGWFEQPGQGVQYQLPFNILTLITQGYLARIAV